MDSIEVIKVLVPVLSGIDQTTSLVDILNISDLPVAISTPCKLCEYFLNFKPYRCVESKSFSVIKVIAFDK